MGEAAARARGRMGGRPREMDRATLMMAMAAMADRKAVAAEVAKRLNAGDHHPLHLRQRQRHAEGRGPGRARRHASSWYSQREPLHPLLPASRHSNATSGDVMPRGGGVPAEALSALRRRLVALPARHPERSALIACTAQLYAVSRATLYRLLRGERRPKDAHRADRGPPRDAGGRARALVRNRRRDEGADHQPERPPSLDRAHLEFWSSTASRRRTGSKLPPAN